MPEIIFVPVDIIENFMVDVFHGLGVPQDEARICADVLITSDLQGIESHGVGRLKYYYDRIKAGVQFTETEMEIVKETETTALVDGHHGMGHVIAYRSMRLAMAKAIFLQPARASLVDDWVAFIREEFPEKARDVDIAAFADGHINGYSVTTEVFANMDDARQLAYAAWDQIFILGQAPVALMEDVCQQIQAAQP